MWKLIQLSGLCPIGSTFFFTVIKVFLTLSLPSTDPGMVFFIPLFESHLTTKLPDAGICVGRPRGSRMRRWGEVNAASVAGFSSGLLLIWCVTLSLYASEFVYGLSRLVVSDSVDYALPGFSVHGILQASILDELSCPPPQDLLHPGTEPTSLTYPVDT